MEVWAGAPGPPRKTGSFAQETDSTSERFSKPSLIMETPLQPAISKSDIKLAQSQERGTEPAGRD